MARSSSRTWAGNTSAWTNCTARFANTASTAAIRSRWPCWKWMARSLALSMTRSSRTPTRIWCGEDSYKRNNLLHPYDFLLNLHELYTHRRSHVELLPRWRELARLLIDPKHHDIVRFLVRGKQHLAGRINLHAARFLAPRRSDSYLCQRSLTAVDCVDGDAVVSAVGSIEKFA